jgi:hypothetical protein
MYDDPNELKTGTVVEIATVNLAVYPRASDFLCGRVRWLVGQSVSELDFERE